jgi:hypothetical protein
MFRARCVPNMYLFGTFSAQNAEEIAARSALRDGSGQRPLASGATTRRQGWVEEYGQPAASVATGGDARQETAFVPPSLRNNSTRIDLERERGLSSAVTGP